MRGPRDWANSANRRRVAIRLTAPSDVLEKKLPNEWVVTLSNEVYLDHEGNSWEGRGIPPEHEWTVFDPANPFSGHMPAVERTVALIDAQVR